MDNTTTTLVYLDEQTADKFILFQQYFIPFSVLLAAKFFEQRAVTLVTRIDKDGVIKSIVRTDLLYSDIPNFNFINPVA